VEECKSLGTAAAHPAVLYDATDLSTYEAGRSSSHSLPYWAPREPLYPGPRTCSLFSETSAVVRLKTTQVIPA
jgi:hypothetical protein